jgi:hypothetical protein
MTDTPINPKNALLMVELDFDRGAVRVQWDEKNQWLEDLPLVDAFDVIGEDQHLTLEYLIRRHVSFALEKAIEAANEIAEFVEEEDAMDDAEAYEAAMNNSNDLSDEQLKQRVMDMLDDVEEANDDLLAKLAKMKPQGGTH